MLLEKLKNKIRRRPKQLDLETYIKKLEAKGYTKDGNIILDPTPMAPPIGYKKAPSMVEIVRDMVRSEKLAQEAREAGFETFEESEDFDVGDEPELLRSPYENQFDPPLEELLKEGRKALQEREEREKAEKAKSGVEGGKPPSEGAPKAPVSAPKEPPEDAS